jgi:hypothetical protein
MIEGGVSCRIIVGRGMPLLSSSCYAETFKGPLSPAAKLVVVIVCMDARLIAFYVISASSSCPLVSGPIRRPTRYSTHTTAEPLRHRGKTDLADQGACQQRPAIDGNRPMATLSPNPVARNRVGNSSVT